MSMFDQTSMDRAAEYRERVMHFASHCRKAAYESRGREELNERIADGAMRFRVPPDLGAPQIESWYVEACRKRERRAIEMYAALRTKHRPVKVIPAPRQRPAFKLARTAFKLART